MSKGRWHLTRYKPNGNDKNLSILEQLCLFQRDLKFLMPVTRLFVESPRETDDDPVTLENCFSDLMLPVLPGLKILRVQPYIDSIPDHALMKFADNLLVTMSIDKKNVHLLC